MRKEIKDLWIAALKSGEFKQGRGKLEDPRTNTYCPLGVLSVLALLEGVCTWEDGRYDGRKKSLSYNIMNWAEIAKFDDEWLEDKTASQVKLVHQGQETTLSELNDSGMSFAEIAEIIELNWRGL